MLQLGNLPADDPAVVLLRKDLKDQAGIPEELTAKLLTSLAGVDYLGSLLKVDAAVEDAIKNVELTFERGHGQGSLFDGFPAQQVKLSLGEAKATILDKLQQFLAKHSKSEDLGLRLDGEQLAAGVRFVRIAKEDTYHVVVGNPPYHGTGKLRDASYYVSSYPEGRPDLFACFYIRALDLLRSGGNCAFITLANWTTLSVYRDFRGVVRRNGLVALAELGKAAFTTGGTLISTSCAVIRKSALRRSSVALRPHSPEELVRDDGQPGRTAAALLLHRGRYEFDPRGFEVIEGEPIVYWWSEEFLATYESTPKLREVAPARKGIDTGDNARFVRRPWEVGATTLAHGRPTTESWVPYILGGKGRSWFEPLSAAVLWAHGGLEIRTFAEISSGCTLRNASYFFVKGIAFSPIGSEFSARAHRVPSICDNKGTSVYCADIPAIVAVMNTTAARAVVQSLNPTVSFQNSDVERIPVLYVDGSPLVFDTLERAFTEHESHRETSVDFRQPGRSAWQNAQAWAQASIDRPRGSSLPPFLMRHEEPAPVSFVSFAVGAILGRFDANGAGTLNVAPSVALPAGILFIAAEGDDVLDLTGNTFLEHAWRGHGASVGEGDELRTYLRKSFFAHHRNLYENRPIYFPLSSARRNFVAYVSIHRWADDTLNILLADHLVPAKRRLEGEIEDLRVARASGNNKGKAEKRFTEVQKLLEELNDFIAKVTEIAEKGPPPPDDKTEKRHAGARFVMDLDDGVMVNSAALWPLLEPQWKDPKKWWKELANAQGKKDYDWSHLAARYFPDRVKKKCHDDPSLAVAHKCFWALHPAKAYAWELRLQDEIRSDFTIDEPGSNEARAAFLTAHEREAAEILARELKRREKKQAKAEDEDGPVFDQESEEPDESDA